MPTHPSFAPHRLRSSNSPLDHAISLLLAGDPEGSLRWSASLLERDPNEPLSLIVASRALAALGRGRPAARGFELAAVRAGEARNLALAAVAAHDLGAIEDPSSLLDRIAVAFAREEQEDAAGPTRPLVGDGDVRPLGRFLSGPALAARAAQLIYEASETIPSPPRAPPFLGPLSARGLRRLLDALDVVTVAAGEAILLEEEPAEAAYWVASGGVEIARRSDSTGALPPMVLTRLGAGAFFGETAFLARLPPPASAHATRPSILLRARRESFDAATVDSLELSLEMGAHCRRHAVHNLGWASALTASVPPQERAALVERLEVRTFATGEKLFAVGDEARGIHLLVAGEIAVLARDAEEKVLLAALTPGETLGEVELLLCRRAGADAVAVRPTATLFLPREELASLTEEHPAILHGLYALAVRHQADTRAALESGAAAVDEGDDCEIEGPTAIRRLSGGETPTARLPAESSNALEERPEVEVLAAPEPPVAEAPAAHDAFEPRPSSLAPTIQGVPSASRPSPPGSTPRRAGSGIAVVGIAAALAALLAIRADDPATHASPPPPVAAASPPPEVTPHAPTVAVPVTLAPPSPDRASAPAAPAVAAPSTHAPAVSRESKPHPSALARSSNEPPSPGASASSMSAPATPAADDFGGRE
ncbi:MAG TPA: cyclic nucleotide-binding domain-containing protein [Polyangiaceae bacterium]|jgi:CRP-like cAMP-binding protein